MSHVAHKMACAGEPDRVAALDAMCSLFACAGASDMIAMPETLTYRRVTPAEIEWTCKVRDPWPHGQISLESEAA